jgi:ribonuclease HI
MNQPVLLTTDGAADQSQRGRGGWAFVARHPDGATVEQSGALHAPTTSNQADLTAVLKGLQSIEEPSHVTVRSDSSYVVNGINSWRLHWRANNWRTKNDTPVRNRSLWEAIDAECNRHTVTAMLIPSLIGGDFDRCFITAEEMAGVLFGEPIKEMRD